MSWGLGVVSWVGLLGCDALSLCACPFRYVDCSGL